MHGFGLWEESKNPRRHENNMQTPHRNARSLLNPWPLANAAKNHWASMPPTFFELFTGNTRCRTKLWLCKICLSCCGKEYVTRRADYRTNTLLGKKNMSSVSSYFLYLICAAHDCPVLYTFSRKVKWIIMSLSAWHRGKNHSPTPVRPESLRRPEPGHRSWDEIHLI